MRAYYEFRSQATSRHSVELAITESGAYQTQMREPAHEIKPIPMGSETYSEAMSDASNYINWILSSFKDYLKPPIIEIGVGHGSYASELKSLGPYIGIDLDPDSVAKARERFPDLTFEVADITDPELVDRFARRQAKSIVCLNVLEHIKDHQAAVRNLAAVLEQDGHLLTIVPAFEALSNDLDRHASHLRRYRRSDVRDLLVNAGLEVVRCEYFNPIGGLGWWANGMMSHKSLNAPAINSQITIFDRFLVPVSRFLNPAAKFLFGQSVLAVGRKP
jgi:SAM-dependent methyltransferase